MNLNNHSLKQIDEPWLRERSREELVHVSLSLLEDLKAARERLNQNSANSSVPPGSELPWIRPSADNSDEEEEEEEIDIPPPPEDPAEENASTPAPEADTPETGAVDSGTDKPAPKRKPGKQPGAKGVGRTQVLPVTGTEAHKPTHCAACGREFPADAASRAHNGFYSVDIGYGDAENPGLHVTNTKHLYYETECECGHTTRLMPHKAPPEDLFEGIELTEWRLAGPALICLIVFLHMRGRMSRARIQEFLLIWLGLELSIGTINQCIHEAGRAAAPVEEQLVDELLESGLLHADETTWLIAGKPFWLWVFVTSTVCLYYITHRGNELVQNLLAGFLGWLMTDGYQVYRMLANRLRCWAHLERKAKGVAQSLDKKAAAFGRQALETLKTLMEAVYQAREGPPGQKLPETVAALLADFKRECERMRDDSRHKKARALAVEFLNDWEAIFMVLQHPHLPLTNNEAERALRHWVIMRKITFGTRSDPGTRVFALLASVIDTCRLRKVSPWRYLEEVIRERRAGRDAPELPAPAVGGV